MLKPYGEALLTLARRRPEVLCLGADLTRQTETDIFRDAIPERFINVGMAEANMIGIAGGLARAGHTVFVNTFGVFCTRRCYDQIAMAVAYPNLNVKIVGFMPGLSSPGGPSHQAIEDVALMRALPNMTVIDPADALEITQAVTAVADHQGPVYLRLKRGEIPLIFDDDHHFDLGKAQVISGGQHCDVCIIGAGMMIPAALAAAQTLEDNGISAAVINAPVIKPFDDATIVTAARKSAWLSRRNRTIIGGLVRPWPRRLPKLASQCRCAASASKTYSPMAAVAGSCSADTVLAREYCRRSFAGPCDQSTCASRSRPRDHVGGLCARVTHQPGDSVI